MKPFLCVCWFVALLILLSLGFETIIWRLIVPVTVSLAQLPWLEFAVRLGAVACSALFISLLKPLGGKV